MIAPKNFLTIILVTIVVSIIIVLNPISEHDPDFSNFTFDAVYLEDKNSILKTFADQSKKSSFSALPFLTMSIFEIVNRLDSKIAIVLLIPYMVNCVFW